MVEVQLTGTAVRARPCSPPLNLPLVCSSRWFGTGQVGTAPTSGGEGGGGGGGGRHTLTAVLRAGTYSTHPTSSRQKELSSRPRGSRGVRPSVARV